MKAERLILSFIALLVGLLVAGVGFYFYQITNTKPTNTNQTITIKPSATPTPSDLYQITVDTPQDEIVIDKKTINISGKTSPNTLVVLSTEAESTATTSSGSGNFSETIAIDDGTNLIYITAFFEDGQERTVTRTITYSTESF